MPSISILDYLKAVYLRYKGTVMHFCRNREDAFLVNSSSSSSSSPFSCCKKTPRSAPQQRSS
jgi:hypothetical protein